MIAVEKIWITDSAVWIKTADEVERGFVINFQNFKNILDVFRAMGAIRGEVNKGDETSSPFHLMVADTIFDLLTDPDRDPEGFSHIVNDNFCRLKALNPEYTKERTETKILQDIASFLNVHPNTVSKIRREITFGNR